MSRVYNFITGSKEGVKQKKLITLEETTRATMMYHEKGLQRAMVEMKIRSKELDRQTKQREYAVKHQEQVVQGRKKELAIAHEKIKKEDQALAKLASAWELEEDRLNKELEDFRRKIQKKIAEKKQEYDKKVLERTNIKTEANVDAETVQNFLFDNEMTLAELCNNKQLVIDEKNKVDSQRSLAESLEKIPMAQRPLGGESGASVQDRRDAIKLFIPHEGENECLKAIWNVSSKALLIKASQLLKFNGVEEAEACSYNYNLTELRGRLVKVLFPDDVKVVGQDRARSPSPDTKREQMVARILEESRMVEEAKKSHEDKKRKRELEESMMEESDEEESKSKKHKAGGEIMTKLQIAMLEQLLSPEDFQEVFGGADMRSAPMEEGNGNTEEGTEEECSTETT